ncbi:hypothetical protein [Shewanella sp. Isolate7]|uniref:hypothetical protein n=1 Tax=Shewanella sp. Isolate7 TaxID=2908528 RepID=UPI001EFE7905|nr:hypothetical protein [Shewanella sp. Isolate7]MCG9720241.1 hypothetical protein [Shewanella sp. Isolate7]
MPKNVGNIFRHAAESQKCAYTKRFFDLESIVVDWEKAFGHICICRGFEGRTFMAIYRLPGGGCASTLLARRGSVPGGFTAASMPPRAKSVLTPVSKRLFDLASLGSIETSYYFYAKKCDITC